MSSKNENQLASVHHDEEKVNEIFGRAQNVYFDSSPYMETRVLAQVRETLEKKKKLMFWRQLTASIATVSLVLALVTFYRLHENQFQATVDQNFAFHIELKNLKLERVARAEVELPNGVHFYSESYPEVAQLRTLDLVFDQDLHDSDIPIVLTGHEVGKKQITVRFFDKENKIVAQKTFNIKFEDGHGKI